MIFFVKLTFFISKRNYSAIQTLTFCLTCANIDDRGQTGVNGFRQGTLRQDLC